MHLVCALVLLCGFARSGVCQEMSFSFYSDASVSGSTVYGTITGSDLSSGCSHWNYYTDAWMYGPTGGNSYTQVSGVGAQISLPSAGAGNYDFYSSTTFLCDCVGGSVNAGGVAEVVQSVFTAITIIMRRRVDGITTHWTKIVKIGNAHLAQGIGTNIPRPA
jgi:hypothetical protein